MACGEAMLGMLIWIPPLRAEEIAFSHRRFDIDRLAIETLHGSTSSWIHSWVARGYARGWSRWQSEFNKSHNCKKFRARWRWKGSKSTLWSAIKNIMESLSPLEHTFHFSEQYERLEKTDLYQEEAATDPILLLEELTPSHSPCSRNVRASNFLRLLMVQFV